MKRALEKAFVIFKEFNSKQKTIQLILNNKAQEYSDTNVMSYDIAKLLVDMGDSNEVYELIKDTEPKHKYVFDLANRIKANDDNKNVNIIENFSFNGKEQKFIAEINGIKFTCEEIKQEYEELAIKIAKVYTEKLPNLIEFIINDIQDMFEEISKETVINSLGVPVIDLDTETITYLEQTLDDVHIIEIEFSGTLDEFHEVCIDG